jgi:hypothetical protein
MLARIKQVIADSRTIDRLAVSVYDAFMREYFASPAMNDNIDEGALGQAYLACPCTCASKEDLRIAIAAYLASKTERERRQVAPRG